MRRNHYLHSSNHGHSHTSHESPFFSLVPVYKSADEARRRHIDVSTILK